MGIEIEFEDAGFLVELLAKKVGGCDYVLKDASGKYDERARQNAFVTKQAAIALKVKIENQLKGKPSK